MSVTSNTGLSGGLYISATGVNAQSAAIAKASQHIANANTTGFKKDEIQFLTLINGSDSGVETSVMHRIDEQGALQQTGIDTDLAIAGNGMFVVNGSTDGDGEILYTRSGAFREDAKGNLKNAAGYYLYAWPLDAEDRLPGASGNIVYPTSNNLMTSLEAVNLRTVGSRVEATSQINLGINLNATEKVLQGPGATFSPIKTSVNSGVGIGQILVPNSNLIAGDNFTIATPSKTNVYTYGGLSQSANISSGILGATTADAPFTTATNGQQFSISNSQLGTLTFTYVASSPTTTSGQFNSLSTLVTAINEATGLTARISGDNVYISDVDANQSLTFANIGGGTLLTSLGFNNVAAAGTALSNNGIASTVDITTGVLGATTATSDFSGATTGDGFSITIPTTPVPTTITLPYSSTVPTPVGSFNNLTELKDLINGTYGGSLSAGIEDNVLNITPVDPTYTMTFANTGGGTSDFVGNLGLQNTTVSVVPIQRFNTLKGLEHMISLTSDLNYIAKGTNSNAQLTIYNKDPLSTVEFSYTRPANSSSHNILKELGVTSDSLIGPAYQATSATANMAGGEVASQFSYNMQIFDPLGATHDFKVGFVKTNVNTWAAEVYSLNPSEIIGRADGLVASGTIVFNGDGSLGNVSNSLSDPIALVWSNGAAESEVTVNWGTAGVMATAGSTLTLGEKDGMQQVAGDYDVAFAEINGLSPSALSSVEISEDGFISANYTNGLSEKLYKIPLVDFPNFNGLDALAYNVYRGTQASGQYSLKECGKGGVGLINSGALEQSTVELTDELRNLIMNQRYLEANITALTACDNALKNVNQRLGN